MPGSLISMQNRLALLCPGQGGQHPAMFDLARADQRAGQQLDQWLADARLGEALNTILSNDALLFSNRLAQPLIAAATLAMWEALRSDVAAPALIAGYSIGELSAYGVAGALSAGDTVILAATRARMMDACLKNGPPQLLIAISGQSAAAIGEITRRYDFHVAIENGEDSFIAGGPAALLTKVQGSLTALGAHVTVLPVEVASHTPFMRPAVAPFADALRHRRFIDPSIAVLSGTSAEMIHASETAILHLSRQIAEKIVWHACMDACAEAGMTVALELGPGAALSRMLRARHPRIECRSVADFRSLDGIKKWLARYVN
jgi:[acyl-carrier-protein] S-malonyltransferase